MEAKGNLLTISPCCCQGTILAPLAAGPLLPGSRAFGLETFWNGRVSESVMRVALSGVDGGSRGQARWPAAPLSRPPVGSRRRSRRRACGKEAGPRGPVTPSSRPPLGVTAPVTAPEVRNGGRAHGARCSAGADPGWVTAFGHGVTSPDHAGRAGPHPARGHVPASRRSRCAAQERVLVTATTARFRRWSRRSWRRSRRRRSRPRDTAITADVPLMARPGHGDHCAAPTPVTAVTAPVTAAPSAGSRHSPGRAGGTKQKEM